MDEVSSVLFGFCRKLRRSIILCLLFIAAAVALKHNCPELRQQVGQWITGTTDSPVVKAVSSMVECLSGGETVKTAVEVFCESLQIP